MQKTLKDFLKRTPLYPMLRTLQRRRRRRRAVRDFWNWTPEDEKRAAFYRQFMSKGDLVFDVGANMGNRAKVFHELGARVVAFEPQLSCYHFLEEVFAGRDSLRLVNGALGKTESVGEMFVADWDILSSLSPAWMEAVQKTGRFSGCKWDRRQTVRIATLDQAIRDFGMPAFVKIDVEGYEYEVLQGLSVPLKCLSIEFVAEYIGNALKCIDRLSAIAPIEARLSYGESMEFQMPSWVGADEIKQALTAIDSSLGGDCYIRCVETSAGGSSRLE